MKVFQKNKEVENIEKRMVDIFKNKLLSQIRSKNRASIRKIEIPKRESIFLQVPHFNDENEITLVKKPETHLGLNENLQIKDWTNKKVESSMNRIMQENEFENVYKFF